MSFSLRNIERHFKASFAGIRPDIKIVVPADVASYDDATAEGGITVNAGKQIYQVTADPRSARARETLTDGIHGHAHSRGLRFTLRRVDGEKAELRTLLMNRRVHLVFTDENCMTYVYLNMKMDTGTEAENGPGANRTVLQFSGASRYPAPFVNAVLLPAPVGQDPGIGTQAPGETYEPGPDEGGIGGGTLADDIGGGTPGGGDPGGGGGDPPTGVIGRAVARQPSTGDLFEIIIGECEEVITIPYVE